MDMSHDDDDPNLHLPVVVFFIIQTYKPVMMCPIVYKWRRSHKATDAKEKGSSRERCDDYEYDYDYNDDDVWMQVFVCADAMCGRTHGARGVV